MVGLRSAAAMGSRSPWRENFGSCSSPDYHRAGLTTAQDIRTAIDYFRQDRTEVQRDRILLMGWSAASDCGIARGREPEPGPACLP